jgi:hypothetical protein
MVEEELPFTIVLDAVPEQVLLPLVQIHVAVPVTVLPSFETVPEKSTEETPSSVGIVPVNAIALPVMVPTKDAPFDVDVRAKSLPFCTH